MTTEGSAQYSSPVTMVTVIGNETTTVNEPPEITGNVVDVQTEDNQVLSQPTTDFGDIHTEAIINTVVIVSSAVCIIFSLVSLVAINRTKKIPPTACFLSSTLLMFDCATTLTYSTRRLVTDSDILNVITLVGIGWSFASFINVTLMTCERLVVFQWPYFYTRRISPSTCIKLLLVVMVMYLGAWTGEWLSCFYHRTGFWNVRSCLGPIVRRYMLATFALLALVTTVCFIKIKIIIVKQRQKVHANNDTVSRGHRGTIVVFLCTLNYLVTAAINLAMTYTEGDLSIAVRRTVLDVLYMLNGLIDSCVYVLWYRECRYEMLKILAVVIPPFRNKVEEMRIEVLEIRGQEQKSETRLTQ